MVVSICSRHFENGLEVSFDVNLMAAKFSWFQHILFRKLIVSIGHIICISLWWWKFVTHPGYHIHLISVFFFFLITVYMLRILQSNTTQIRTVKVYRKVGYVVSWALRNWQLRLYQKRWAFLKISQCTKNRTKIEWEKKNGFIELKRSGNLWAVHWSLHVGI